MRAWLAWDFFLGFWNDSGELCGASEDSEPRSGSKGEHIEEMQMGLRLPCRWVGGFQVCLLLSLKPGKTGSLSGDSSENYRDPSDFGPLEVF